MTPRRSQAGFTLVELMVSLVVFSFAMAGVLAVAASMANGYREQRAAVEAEAAVRAPIDYLAEAVREASPGVPSGTIYDVGDAATCAETPAALRVQDAYGSAPYTGTDMLDVVYASGGVVTALGSTGWDGASTTLTLADTSQLQDGDTLVISNYSQGVVVHNVKVINATTVTIDAPQCTPITSFPAGSLVIRAQHAIFFIGTAEDGQPALMMNPTGDSTKNTDLTKTEPLAEGIEDLQVAIGQDTDGNGIVSTSGPDEWLDDSASNVAAGTPYVPATSQLRAVRISLVAREPVPLASMPLNSFQRPALEDHAAGSFDQYPRRILRTTAEIRNTGASP